MDLQHLSQLPLETLLFGVSILLVLSVLASKASTRLGVPSLLLFLVIGMFAGSEGPGRIEFDYPRLAQSLGVLALIVILFSGGLDTEWDSIRKVWLSGLALSTLGVGLTALLVAWFATSVLGFSLLEGFLLGSIVSATDAAAVFSVLRSRHAHLKGHLTPLLELESGSNDPMAVMLTVGMVTWLTQSGFAAADLAPMFLRQILLGAFFGYAMGKGMVFLISKIKLENEGLYSVLSLALVMFIYGATASAGGNGFLAVYMAGLIQGNSAATHREYLSRFHDGLAWLMQIVMFLTLGLQVFPSQIVPVVGVGLVLAGFLMFVARPVSVFVTLLFSDFDLKEKVLVSWGGLRGAVPIILATFPLIGGVPHSKMIFNLVFFIVLTSVLFQGTTLPLLAQWLGLNASPVPTPHPEGRELTQVFDAHPPEAYPLLPIAMSDTPKRKPYTTPQVYRVDLDHEQAILTSCSLLSTNAMAGGMDVTCRSGGCKRGNTGGASDSGQRPS